MTVRATIIPAWHRFLRQSAVGATAFAAISATLLGGCGAAPANAERSVIVSSTPVQLGGVYDITFLTRFSGPVVGRFELEQTATELRANTRPGAAGDLVGDVEGLLGRLISPFVFPSGMLVTWKSTIPTPSAPGEGSIGFGSLSWLRLRTTMDYGADSFKIIFRDDRTMAIARLDRVAADGTPSPRTLSPTDYRALAGTITTVMPQVLYDAELGKAGETTGYLADLRNIADLAKDDIEFLTGAALSGRKHVRYAMPIMYRQPTDDADAAVLEDVSRPYRVFRDTDTEIYTIRIDAFVTAAMVDAAFRAATATPSRGIILDLRTCAGVEIESLRAAQWLLREETPAGITFGPTTRARILAGDTSQLPTATLRTAADFDAARSTLRSGDALSLRVAPAERTIDGPIAILTSRRTSSTAEWLIALLKRTGRARLFGEPTAGRPYLSKETPIGQGWVFRTASYDFLPQDHPKLQGTGVIPDQRVSLDSAEDTAKQWLLRTTEPAATPSTPSP